MFAGNGFIGIVSPFHPFRCTVAGGVEKGDVGIGVAELFDGNQLGDVAPDHPGPHSSMSHMMESKLSTDYHVVTASTVTNTKGVLAIVASPAELSCFHFVHGNLDHFFFLHREDFRIVTV